MTSSVDSESEVCDRDPKIEKHASELDEVCVVTRSQAKRLTEKILTNPGKTNK